MKFSIRVLFLFLVLVSCSPLMVAQIGISVSPPRIYYQLDKGQSKTEDILVTNVSTTSQLDVSISLSDWKYSLYGENLMFPADTLDTSCASWISINGPAYLSLKPGESKNLSVTLTVPTNISDSIPVHTAILYVTQMNPTEKIDQAGANMQISVRSGIKIYHQTSKPEERKIEITNLAYIKDKNVIQITFENQGNIWINGNIMTDLLAKASGKEVSLDNVGYYTLPNDTRIIEIPLPSDIAKGEYTVTTLIDTGDENVLEAAELRFSIE